MCRGTLHLQKPVDEGGARLCDSVEPFSGSNITDASRYRLGQEAVPKYDIGPLGLCMSRSSLFIIWSAVVIYRSGMITSLSRWMMGELGHVILMGCVLYMGLNVESGQCQG